MQTVTRADICFEMWNVRCQILKLHFLYIKRAVRNFYDISFHPIRTVYENLMYHNTSVITSLWIK